MLRSTKPCNLCDDDDDDDDDGDDDDDDDDNDDDDKFINDPTHILLCMSQGVL